jgi:hypothetical protein
VQLSTQASMQQTDYYNHMPQGDSWTVVQTVAIIVAALGAVITVVTTLVTGRLSSKRDRTSWLRETQGKANTAYIDAMHEYSDAMHSGPLDRALHTPGFAGLDEAWQHSQEKTAALSTAVRHLQSSGSWHILVRATRFNAVAGPLMALAHPLSGAANEAALSQRTQAINAMSLMLLSVDFAIRLEGKLDPLHRRTRTKAMVRGPLEWNNRRLTRSVLTPADKEVDKFLERISEAAGHQSLINWLVRDFDGNEAGGNYLVSDPWELSQAMTQNRYYQGPMWAVLVKIRDEPWRYALSEHAPDVLRDALYTDAAEIVRYGGRGGQTKLAAAQWIDGVFISRAGVPTHAQLWLWKPPE